MLPGCCMLLLSLLSILQQPAWCVLTPAVRRHHAMRPARTELLEGLSGGFSR